MKDIVIVGASGFAREIKWIIDRINQTCKCWNFIGFIDNDIANYEVIGNDAFLIESSVELNVVIAIANPIIRKKLVSLYKNNKNLKFPNLIDPSVLFSESINMGEGNIICAGNIMTVNIEIGNFNIVNLNCTIGHDVIIEDYVTLNPSVNISGNVYLEDDVSVGTGSQIIQGKKIGKQAVIGAGATVINDIPNSCTVVGVPAKIIKDRR